MDRPTGTLNVDHNGHAAYLFPITVPPGVGRGNDPSLCLRYSQAYDVASPLGLRWLLGGLGSIFKIPPSLAVNSQPRIVEQKISVPWRLAFDGAELICFSGSYGSTDARYSTEVERGETVSALANGGFAVTDSNGQTREYGTSEDSRIVDSSQKDAVVEWKIKKQIDVHGNYITFNYSTTPSCLTPSSASSGNVAFIDTIHYTSNDNTSYSGRCWVKFYYESRDHGLEGQVEDTAISSVRGLLVKFGHRLARIETRVGDVFERASLAKAFNMSYKPSPSSGELLLATITEYGSDNTPLEPLVFSYTDSGTPIDGNLFVQDQNDKYSVACGNSNSDLLSVLPVDTTGKGIMDLVILEGMQPSGPFRLRTHVAQSEQQPGNSKLRWNAPRSEPGSDIQLPKMDGYPMILVADLNQDGRTDLVVPYKEFTSKSLYFAILRANGHGFDPAISVPTRKDWSADSRYLLMDTSGNGLIDIVRITNDSRRNTIFFQLYYDVSKMQSGLVPASSNVFTYNSRGETKDWFPIKCQTTGTAGLIRIWEDKGSRSIGADVFTYAAASDGTATGNFELLKSNPGLLTYADDRNMQRSTLLCDLNGDGCQDLVYCSIRTTGTGGVASSEIIVSPFLHDGSGNFSRQPDQSYIIRSVEFGDRGRFYAVKTNAFRFDNIAFVYPNGDNKTWTSLIASGSSSGHLKPFRSQTLFSTLGLAAGWPAKDAHLLAVDINGDGGTTWLPVLKHKSSGYVYPVYGTTRSADHLKEVTTPLGRRSRIGYASLRDPKLYDPAQEPEDGTSLPNAVDNVPCLGLTNYVVSEVKEENDATINTLPFNARYKYQYGGAMFNRDGRGWCGFGRISRTELVWGVREVTSYYQHWPLSGTPHRIDTYGRTPNALKRQLGRVSGGHEPVEDDTGLVLMQSVVREYKTVTITDKPACVLARQVAIQKNFFDNDPAGNPLLARQLITEFTYEGQSPNRIIEYSYELDKVRGGAATSEFWTFKSYAKPSSLGVAGLANACKMTSVNSAPDFTKFYDGDLSLKTYTLNEKGLPTIESEWSSDLNMMTSKNFSYDGFGNILSQTSPVGLTTSFDYHDVYPQYAVRCSLKGEGVDLTTEYGFDSLTGDLVATVSEKSNVSITLLDVWGREIGKAVSASKNDTPDLTIKAEKTLTWAASSTLVSRLQSTKLCRTEETGYLFLRDTLKSTAYWYKSIAKLSGTSTASTDATLAALKYVDCLGRVRRSIEHGHNDKSRQRSWKCSEYDVANHTVLKTNSYVPTTWNDLPDLGHSTLSIFDAMGRQIVITRPTSNEVDGFTSINTIFTRGGASRLTELWVAPSIEELSSPNVGDKKPIETDYQEFRYINQKDRVVFSKNSSGKEKRWDYNGRGLVTWLKDAGGREEWRKYNSFGSVSEIDDPYQNIARKARGIVRSYDADNRLLKEVNVLGESSEYRYDAAGRTLEIMGRNSDSKLTRKTLYVYDKPDVGMGQLASVSMDFLEFGDNEPRGVRTLRYEYSYDEAGRRSGEKLNVLGEGPFFPDSKPIVLLQEFTYDRLDRIKSQVWPDTSRIIYEYDGLDPKRVTMLAPTGESWDVTAQLKAFAPSGLPSDWSINGSSFADGGFEMRHVFNTHGLPTQMSLLNGKTLEPMVDYNIDYDPKDMIRTLGESVGKTSTSYDYVDRRLMASHGVAERRYAYNDCGDLVDKDGMTIEYSQEDGLPVIRGSKNGKAVFFSKSDLAGRVIERQANENGSKLLFNYDTNGKLSSVSGPQGTTRVFSDQSLSTIVRQVGDDTLEIRLGTVYREIFNKNGSRIVKRQLDLNRRSIANVISLHTGSGSKTTFNVFMTDHKGSVTHIYALDRTLVQHIQYDDYGQSIGEETNGEMSGPRFEGTDPTGIDGLLDFHARLYDPVIGRFTTPDSILELDQTVKPDGMNRMVFENNDPVNHTDPTGHFTESFWITAIVGVAAVLGGIAVTLGIFGAGTGIVSLALYGALSGFLIGAGVASVKYAWQHRAQTDRNDFWKGWGMDTLVIGGGMGAVTGLVTAGAAGWFNGAAWSTAKAVTPELGAAVTQAVEQVVLPRIESSVARFATNYLVGGVTNSAGNVASTFATTAWENQIYKTRFSVDGASVAQSIGITLAINLGSVALSTYGASNSGQKLAATAKAFAKTTPGMKLISRVSVGLAGAVAGGSAALQQVEQDINLSSNDPIKEERTREIKEDLGLAASGVSEYFLGGIN